MKGGQKEMNKFSKLFLLSVSMFVFLMGTIFAAVEPTGGNVAEGSSATTVADPADSTIAIAGNVTELTITSDAAVTQTWQGYYGNVSGTIVLSDASDNAMFDWSLASPEGEVYASTNNTVNWDRIQCLNFASDGTYLALGDEVAGAMNQHGTNLDQLEAMFGIVSDDVDGVNETFSLAGTHESGEGLAHDLFYTNNLEFAAGECYSTHIFDDTGSATDGKFQEVLLYEPESQSVIFASILDEEGPMGFDDRNHDFQMLVLENGHGTDTATTTYYFWVELE